jgi:hypothetical protein
LLPKEGKCVDAVIETAAFIATPFVVIVHAPGKVIAAAFDQTVPDASVNVVVIAVVFEPVNV